jgi:hypothetical protein
MVTFILSVRNLSLYFFRLFANTKLVMNYNLIFYLCGKSHSF